MPLAVSLLAAAIVGAAFIILLICTAVSARRPLRRDHYTRVQDDEDDVISV